MSDSSNAAPSADTSKPTVMEAIWRNKIASYVIQYSFYILMGMLAFGYLFSLPNFREKEWTSDAPTILPIAKELISLILPVLGTWVGTVLAFYFARENFEAATKALASGVKPVIETIRVVDVMLARDRILNAFTFKDSVTEDSITVRQLMEALKEKAVKRLIFFEANGSVRYVLHDGAVYRDFALYGNGKAAPAPDETAEEQDGGASGSETETGQTGSSQDAAPEPEALRTLRDLLDSDNEGAGTVREMAKAFKFVSEAGTLGDCQRRMADGVCKDVFVTKSGGHNEPPLGWITDLDVRKHAKPDASA